MLAAPRRLRPSRMAATSAAALATGALLAVAASTPATAAVVTPARPHKAATASRSGLLVVLTKPGQAAGVAASVTSAGGTVQELLPALDTLVVKGVSPTGLRSLAGVTSVTADVSLSGKSAGWGDDDWADPSSIPTPAAVTPSSGTPTSATPTDAAPSAADQPVSLRSAEAAIRARQVWPITTGRRIDVALIDTGIAPVQGLNAPGKVVNGPDLSFESQNDDRRYIDNYGHGTAMAGIIAANDLAASGANPLGAGPNDVEGVAPGARLVNVKVGDGNGVTDVSQVLAALDWVVEHAHDPNGAGGTGLNIRVVNLSYGTDSSQSEVIDPLAHAAEVAWRSGIVVVAAAGNDGDTQGRLADPAIDPYVIAVGADDSGVRAGTSDDSVADFSSRGDGVRNPDVVAPGVHIASLDVPGSAIDTAYGDPAVDGPRLIRGSGTSQATAMVSGAAALLLSARPNLTPDQVKALLVRSAHPISGTDATAQGAGLIDLVRAAFGSSANASQNFPVSTGGGSLEASRGTKHVELNGVELTGEQDIFGVPYDSAAEANAEESGSAWTDGSAGGIWNGSSWAGSSWAGSSWAGSSWAGSSWAGSSWAGSSWAGTSWASAGWGDQAPDQTAP